MDVKSITDFYKKEIKSYINGRDSYFLTKLQKQEIYTTHLIDSNDLARQYALELIDCIDVLKSKGLL